MFKTIADFLAVFKDQAGGTAKVLDALTDKSLAQSVAEGHRTMGQIAWHIVTSIPEMMNRTGLKVKSVAEDAPMPAKAAEIARVYEAVSEELAARIKDAWKDDTLLVEDDLYGFKWKRGFTLWVLLIHEIHHRGQMTVLMRQAGLKVPGVVGPSKEEWAQYDMRVPEM